MHLRLCTSSCAILTALGIVALTTKTFAADVIDPGNIVSGVVTGTLGVVDVPYLTLGGTSGSYTPPFTATATTPNINFSDEDLGFRWLTSGSITEDFVNGNAATRWEPDGTPFAESRTYSFSGNARLEYRFNAATGLNLPDGSTINSVYAVFPGRGIGSRTRYSYNEGALITTDVTHNPSSVGDLVLQWTDDAATTRNSNFQRIFSTPFTIAGGDGFSLFHQEVWHRGYADAIVIDYSLPPDFAYWNPAGGPATLPGTWDNATTNWNDAAGGGGGQNLWSAGQRPVFAAGTAATGTYTVSVAGVRDIDGAVFEEGNVTLAPAGTPGPHGLRLTTNTGFTVESGATAQIDAVISEDGTQNFTKVGPGDLTLTADNSFTGPASLSGGILSIPSIAAAGSNSPLGAFPTPGADGLFLTGGTLQYTGPTATTDRGFTMSSDSTIDVAGDGVTLALGASATSGTLAVTGGNNSMLSIDSIALDATTTFAPDDVALTIGSINGSGNLVLRGNSTGNEITGNIIDRRTVTVNGVGSEWRLAGTASTFDRGVRVERGTLLIGANQTSSGSPGPLGRNNEVYLGVDNSPDAASLLIDGPYRVANSIRIDSPSNNPDTQPNRVITLGGSTADASEFSGPVSIGFYQNNGSDSGYSKGITVTAATGGTVTFSGVIRDPLHQATRDPLAVIHAATITAVTKVGDGTVIFENDNTYLGATDVQAGVLQIGNGGTSGSLQPNNLTIAADATVRFNRSDDHAFGGDASGAGHLEKLGGATLTLGGDLSYTGDTTIAAGTLEFSNTGTSTLTGAVTGAGGLTKSNSGTLSTGSLAYAGPTLVNGGTLIVNGVLSSANPITVLSAGTLGGSFSAPNAAITVNGTASPGNSPGTLGPVPSYGFGLDSTYDWELHDGTGGAGSGWDLIDVNGPFSIADTNRFTIDITGLSQSLPLADVVGVPINVTIQNGVVSGPFDIVQFNSNSITGAIGDVMINAGNLDGLGFFTLVNTAPGGGAGALQLNFTATVPEPGTWAMLIGLLLAIGIYRHRRQEG